MCVNHSKSVAIVDHEKAQKHTWLIAKLDGTSHPVSSKGYKDGQLFYSLLENGQEVCGHDLYRLKDQADMTEAEFEALRDRRFEDFDSGETIEVS